MIDVDPNVEQPAICGAEPLVRSALRGEPADRRSVHGGGLRKRASAKWKAEIEALKTEMTATLEQYPPLLKSLEKFWTAPQRRSRTAPRHLRLRLVLRSAGVRSRPSRRRSRTGAGRVNRLRTSRS